jgi:phospho-N-acetylmuramoyl-pentapeptide-transferase
VFGATVACAFVGFADDYMKIVRRRSLGLRGRTKMVLLFLISVGLWWVATHKAGMSESVSLRPIHAHVYLGAGYIIFIYLVFAGTTNAVNLTDGLDGLAAGCGAIALLAYVGITFVTTSGSSHDLELVAGCMCGACIGFLWFNSFPASVFMGDTGSLAIGGAVAAMAVMTNTEILLVVIGGIFVLEALSVLIQVLSFRVWHKRVFKMAPIHHHFELEAWSETKIMLRFWIVAAACGAIGFTLYQVSGDKTVRHVRTAAAQIRSVPPRTNSAAVKSSA